MLPWLAILAVLVACGGEPAKFACERTISGLDKHLVAGRIVWFGEMHGTEESPRFVGDAVCHAAKRARVQLGLEVPHGEQKLFDAYLRSKGTAADRKALLAGEFWGWPDGRSSLGMLELVERVRRWRQAGIRVDIVLFDDPIEDRERAMSKQVMNKRDGKAIFIALSGNIHSRKQPPPQRPDLVPAVAHLVAAKLPVTTFNASASGGTFWGCVSTDDHEPVCGVHENGKDADGKPWTLGPAPDAAHDGVYFVGTTKASHPARSR